MRIAIPLQFVLFGVRASQFGPDREQLMLDRVEHLIELGRKPRAARCAENRIKFIDRTVGANPSVIL